MLLKEFLVVVALAARVVLTTVMTPFKFRDPWVDTAAVLNLGPLPRWAKANARSGWTTRFSLSRRSAWSISARLLANGFDVLILFAAAIPDRAMDVRLASHMRGKHLLMCILNLQSHPFKKLHNR